MRESLVKIFDNDTGVIQHQVPVYQRRDAVVGIEIQQILGKIFIVDIDDIYIEALLGQHQPDAMTPRIGRRGKERRD